MTVHELITELEKMPPNAEVEHTSIAEAAGGPVHNVHLSDGVVVIE